MTTATALSPEIETFLRGLRMGLAALRPEDRDDVIAEVRSHLEERQAQGRPHPLDGFGDPADYAAQFLAERTLTSALAHGTSFALGRALLTGGVRALTAAATAVVLSVQLAALALVLAGIMKPFVPSHIGLFLDASGGVQLLGFSSQDLARYHEVLGGWAVPLFIATGGLLMWLGNQALRALARRRVRGLRCGSL